jgi:hypothetical protein
MVGIGEGIVHYIVLPGCKVPCLNDGNDRLYCEDRSYVDTASRHDETVCRRKSHDGPSQNKFSFPPWNSVCLHTTLPHRKTKYRQNQASYPQHQMVKQSLKFRIGFG